MMKEQISGFGNIIAGLGGYTIFDSGYRYKDRAKRIECADGASLSVQASELRCCRPRTDEGPYSHIEVGFPSAEPPESWAEYFDGDWANDEHTDLVYSHIPVALVQEYIDAHGGEEKG